jgi:serine/threonine-protein kinase
VGSTTLEAQLQPGSAEYSTAGTVIRRLSPDLAPGTLVGDYRIDHTIGIGGMGAVYGATQPVIGKRVAIKLLHQSKSQIALNRFVKEARAVNLIGHPNIVDVFGFGMTDDGRAYLVMELLVGETLAVRAKRGPMSLAEIAEVLIEVTQALEAAHEAGVIHRDLKPENVFLTKRKGALTVKLLDFGIAKLISDSEPGMSDDTRPGVLIGTPQYVSPEQVFGKVLDGGADIYALGVVAFELMAGRPPFVASEAFELFEKHAKLRPPKPSAFNAELPEAADVLIGSMLAKEPGERPSLVAIRDALIILQATPAAAVTGPRSAAAIEPTDVHALPHPATTTVSDRLPTQLRPTGGGVRRVMWSAGMVGVAVATISLTVLLVGHRTRERIAPLPTVTIAPANAPATGALPPEPADHNHVGSAEPEIELAPVAAGSSAHGPRRINTAHVKHDRAHAQLDGRPAPQPTTARSNDKPGAAGRNGEGDDAVRSPFEHGP